MLSNGSQGANLLQRKQVVKQMNTFLHLIASATGDIISCSTCEKEHEKNRVKDTMHCHQSPIA